MKNEIPQYVIEKMGGVGCGVGDCRELKQICDALTVDECHLLDGWHNNGFNIPLKAEFEALAQSMRNRYNRDELICMSAFVSAMRNVTNYKIEK